MQSSTADRRSKNERVIENGLIGETKGRTIKERPRSKDDVKRSLAVGNETSICGWSKG